MVVSRDKAPTAQETFMQMAQAAGLRGRLLVTVGMLILVRFGVFLPVPGIDREAFEQNVSGSPLIGFFRFIFWRGLTGVRNFCFRHFALH